jgi:hypothetical protein
MTEPTIAPPAPPRSSPFMRPALALMAGIGVTVLIVVFGTLVTTLAALRGVDPKHFVPSAGYLATILAVSALGALAGGFTTSRITAGRSFFTVCVLALMLFVSGAIPAFRGTPPAGQPSWYPHTIAFVAPLGVLIGGALERRRRIRWTRQVR